jgi:hypothetical protein
MENAGKVEPRASEATPDNRGRGALGPQRCPCCGAELVSRMHHAPGKGYTISWRCPSPHCGYRRVLL